MPGYYLIPAMKRSIRGKTLTPIREDYTDKQIDKLLLEVIGKPGVSAGKAQKAMEQSMTASSGTSAYTAAQADIPQVSSDSGSFGSGLGGVIGAIFSTLLGAAHADYAAKKAYERQNEYTENYLTPSAQVKQYEDAGLNPMGLAGGGAGVTSAPSVQPAQTPSMDGITSILGTLLNYKSQMARIGVDNERVQAYKQDIASQVAYREERRLTQEKINAWYDTNQVANLDRVESETALNYERAETEYQKQALLFNQAIAQSIKNEYAEQWEQNAIRLQEAELRYKESATAENYAQVKVLNQRAQYMVLDAWYTVSKAQNMKACTEYLGIKTDMLKFDKEHQRADKVWQRVGQAVGAVEGVTRSAANVFSCFAHVPAPPVAPARPARYESGGVYNGRWDSVDVADPTGLD